MTPAAAVSNRGYNDACSRVNGFGADGTRQTPDLSVLLYRLSFTPSRFVFYSVLALSCRGSASPINGIKRYARRRFGRGPANAHRPLTTMVPLMVPLVSPVTKFRHRSMVKLPLAPAYRPVPPTMVLVSTR